MTPPSQHLLLSVGEDPASQPPSPDDRVAFVGLTRSSEERMRLTLAAAVCLTKCVAAPRPTGPHADNHAANVASLDSGVLIGGDDSAAAQIPVGFPFKWKCRVTAVGAAPGPPPSVPLGPLPGLPTTTTWRLGLSTA